MKFLLITLLSVSAPALALAQDAAFSGRPGVTSTPGTIGAARELYAGARYDEALVILDGLRQASDASVDERKTIEQYRSFCLLALGRGSEAETAIAAVVTVDPFYQPSEADASPRVRSTFAEVRQRLLPDLAAARYARAKQAYDRKQFADAAAQFRELVVLLDDPQMRGRHNDLHTLASGFVELAVAAAAPPPAPKEEVKEPEPAAPTPPGPVVQKIYTGAEPGIVPPVTIRQEVPAVPASIRTMMKTQALVDLVIDEKGRLVSISLRSGVHPMYDTLLVNAAREWKYEPAKLNGVAVQFRKLLQLSITR